MRVAVAASVLALLLPIAAGARSAEPPAAAAQACLSPAEMAALFPASRERAEDRCEAGDARALGRVRAVLRLRDAMRPAGGAPPAPAD